jgi:lysophospholipase L1-like esterase
VNDPHSYKVDLGMQWTYGIGNYGHPSMRSMDGLHPSAAATAEYAAAVAAAIARTVDH